MARSKKRSKKQIRRERAPARRRPHPREVETAEDREKPLTRDKSERIDFATLGDRPIVDSETNERAGSRARTPANSPDGPAPEDRRERVRQRLPTPSP